MRRAVWWWEEGSCLLGRWWGSQGNPGPGGEEEPGVSRSRRKTMGRIAPGTEELKKMCDE